MNVVVFQVYFQLASNMDRQTLLNELSAPYSMRGTTNTTFALFTVRTDMLTPENGEHTCTFPL